MRAKVAMLSRPSAMEGSTRWSMPPVEEGGSQPRMMAKTRMSRMPLQKVGRLCAAITSQPRGRTNQRRPHSASTMPAGMPMPAATSSAPPASASV
jgi:hypothetical protein